MLTDLLIAAGLLAWSVVIHAGALSYLLAGTLMCGWSTAFFFAVVTRIYEPAVRETTAR